MLLLTPDELRPGLDALDRHIAGIAEVYREAVAATLGPFTPAELVRMNEAQRGGLRLPECSL